MSARAVRRSDRKEKGESRRTRSARDAERRREMTADESSKSPKPTLDSNGVSASTVTAGSPPASGGAAAGSPAPSSDEKPSPQLQELIARGLDLRLATRLEKLFASTNLVAKDLDDRAVEALKEFGNVDGAISVLDEFEESNLQHVANKSAFLCGLMKVS